VNWQDLYVRTCLRGRSKDPHVPPDTVSEGPERNANEGKSQRLGSL